MNTAGALKEGEKQITFLNRQPMGCASLKHGSKESSFEIMLHRQLRMDDGRGLAQGVHDSSRTSAPIWILFDSPKKSDKLYKRLRHHLQHDKVIFQASPGMLLLMFLYLSIYLFTFLFVYMPACIFYPPRSFMLLTQQLYASLYCHR